jgi:hypothetical protein
MRTAVLTFDDVERVALSLKGTVRDPLRKRMRFTHQRPYLVDRDEGSIYLLLSIEDKAMLLARHPNIFSHPRERGPMGLVVVDLRQADIGTLRSAIELAWRRAPTANQGRDQSVEAAPGLPFGTRLRDQIHSILLKAWDPIGVGFARTAAMVDDEYAQNEADVERLLVEPGTTKAAVRQYLKDAAYWLSPTFDDDDRITRTTDLLWALRDESSHGTKQLSREDRHRKKVEAMRSVIREEERTSRRHGDPNDRHVDQEAERRMKQMKPEDLDRLLRDDDEEGKT